MQEVQHIVFVKKMSQIGELVKYHRKRAGLTQLALADLGGVGKTTVFDIEHGKLTVQLDSLLSVLGVLNISIELSGPFSHEFAEKQEDCSRE